MTISLAYASLSNVSARSPEMLDIARTCLARNPGLGITGALYFDGAQFYQVIEGEETSVRDLYARIRRDPRHRAVQTLWDGPIPHRRFGTWAMKFVDGTGSAARLRPRFGYERVVEQGETGQRRLEEALARA